MVFVNSYHTAGLDPYIEKTKVELVRVFGKALPSGREFLREPLTVRVAIEDYLTNLTFKLPLVGRNSRVGNKGVIIYRL